MSEQEGPPVPTDDAIREMLETRIERAGQIRFDAALVATDAVRRAGSRPRSPSLLPRLALAVTSVAAVLVLTLVVAMPLTSQRASAPPTTGPATSLPPGPTASPVALPLLLTPAELGTLVRTRASELDGTIAAVRGRLERDPSMPCVAGEPCANTLLADSGGGFHLRPVGDIGPGPWDGSGPKDGTFAVRITAKLESGRPVVEFIGDLVKRKDGTFVLSVAEVVRGAVKTEGAYAVVDGWLVRSPLHPCPSNPRPPAGPPYGCPDDDWLTEVAFQPLQPNGSSVGARDAVALPAGSYDEWAPNPSRFGPDGLGVEPRHATWLMWLVRDSCAPNADCFGSQTLRWRIVGRFDPIPNLDPSPTPAPSAPSAAGGPYPGGIPRSVDGQPVLVGIAADLQIASAVDDTPFLVGSPWHDGPQICSGGIIVDPDPNLLAVRGCNRYAFEGVEGRLYFPPALRVFEPGGPLVLRVHRNDLGAGTCRDVEACRRTLVIDGVAWQGDETTVAAPIGVPEAIALATPMFANDRAIDPRAFAYVDEDIFAIPIACPAPAPSLTYQIRGDPRMGLVAVFPDVATRERVQAATDPASFAACLHDVFPRSGPARWLARDNVLMLLFADDADTAHIERNFDITPGADGWSAIPLPGPKVDLSIEVIDDYLAARAAGMDNHAPGERLVLDQSDPRIDAHAEWRADTQRRFAANALKGPITLLSDHPTAAQLGPWVRANRPRGSEVFLYRVDYPDSSDPALASETFVVIHDPASEFRDWLLVRVDGAAYPEVLVPPQPPAPSRSPNPATDGSGDTSCGPTPCGENEVVIPLP